MHSLVRASVALVWRIAFATAIMPVILLSGLLGWYPIATVGTLILCAGGAVASGVAVGSMLQSHARREAVRGSLVVLAVGIAAWAALDVILFRSVLIFVLRQAEQLPSTSTLSLLTLLLPAIGVIGTLLFISVSTPRRRRLALLMSIMATLFAGWLLLNHQFFFHRWFGLVAVRGYEGKGMWLVGWLAVLLGLLFVALGAALVAGALRVVRWTRDDVASAHVPTAIARRQPDA